MSRSLRPTSLRRHSGAAPATAARRVMAPSILVLALCLSAACTAPPAPPAEPVYNVILISIDTLRADHLGAYGYPRPTTPRIDAFAADSVVFTEAIAQAPSTLHSHASMLSSLLPQHHRASWSARTRLPEESLTLAEVLLESGYRTIAFTGGGQMARIFGLDQGFESYREPGEQHFSGTVDVAIEWMDEKGDRPFFLFLHNYEVHHPYEPDAHYRELLDIRYDGPLPENITKELLEEIRTGDLEIDDADLAYIVGLYDAEIRSMDDGFGRLVDYLKSAGMYDRTMILFTSDHGEEFNEHGVVGFHSHSLYDELLRVPLIVKYPDNRHAGTVVEQQVRGIDVAPTVLGFLGLPNPTEFSGADVGPLVRGEEMAPLEAISRMDRKAGRERSSIRTSEWKLAGLAKRRSLFNLVEDPEELWDRSLKDSGVAEELQQRLEAIIASRQPYEAPVVAPPEATLDELRKLGYLN